jgi:L-malate glycosyltransferase
MSLTYPTAAPPCTMSPAARSDVQRVLYLTNNPIPGGTARVMLDWLRLGRANGLAGAVALQWHGDLSNSLRELGIPQQVTPMPWPGRRTCWPWLRATWNITRWGKLHRAQIVHCQEHDVYPFGRYLRKTLSVPVVSHVQFKIDRGFAQWAFGGKRQPDALIWTSHVQRRDCEQAIAGIVSEDRQYTLPMGLDIEEFARSQHSRIEIRRRLGVRDDQVLVGAASAIRDRKRIHDFLDLAANVHKRCPEAVFAFAGDVVRDEREYGEKMVRRLRSLQDEGVLLWLGHMEPVEPFMQMIDIFVSTSEYETFGMSVCEAMACGHPVVGYRGGSVEEVVGDTGAIVDNGDLASLSAVTTQLVTDDRLRRELGAKARGRVAEQFNPRDSLRRLHDIYASVLR